MDATKSDTRSVAGQGDNLHHHGHEHMVAPHERKPRDRSHIQGWGADLDRKNRPAVPMKHSPPRLEETPIAPASQQPQRMEIVVSPERPHIPSNLGTSAAPKWASGMLRRLAYKVTENDIRHFMLLQLADRINVVEGLGEDLANGHVPNVLGEMNMKAEWEHNRVGPIKKAAVATAVVGLGVYLLRRRENR